MAPYDLVSRYIILLTDWRRGDWFSWWQTEYQVSTKRIQVPSEYSVPRYQAYQVSTKRGQFSRVNLDPGDFVLAAIL